MQKLADKMIDDHICQLCVKKHQHALKEVKAMATMTNHHNVPMEIMTLPMAMHPVFMLMKMILTKIYTKQKSLRK